MKCLCDTKLFNLTLFTRLMNSCTTRHNIETLISVVIKPVSVLARWCKLRPFLLLLEITHSCRGQIFATVSIILTANPIIFVLRLLGAIVSDIGLYIIHVFVFEEL